MRSMRFLRPFRSALPFLSLPASLLLLPLPAVLPSSFTQFWARRISRPMLGALNTIGSSAPFSLAELGLLLTATLLFVRFVINFLRFGAKRALLYFFRRISLLLAAFLLALSALWLPLYPSEPIQYSASETQIVASCEALIEVLNASELDFSAIPDDLPAKFAAFPRWMRAMNISGVYSFLTGEALISPELAPEALPFVAAHEAMHALGYAGEGEANIAAWTECLRRGGLYADSARLWALKYSSEALSEIDPDAWAACRSQMSARTLAAFRRMGGESSNSTGGTSTILRMLGAGSSADDYEILALRLASQPTF